MIVFLNQEEQNVTIYKTDGVHIVPFLDITQIYAIIGNSNVLYITDATETNAQDITELVSELTGQEISPPPNIIDKIDMTYVPFDLDIEYVHSVSKGPLNIPDLNAPPEEYKNILNFVNRYDIKFFDDEFKAKMKKYPIINQCIKSGKLKIIDENEKQRLYKERDINKKKKEDWIQKEENARKNIASGGSVEQMAENMFTNDIIITEMDITDEVNSIK